MIDWGGMFSVVNILDVRMILTTSLYDVVIIYGGLVSKVSRVKIRLYARSLNGSLE